MSPAGLHFNSPFDLVINREAHSNRTRRFRFDACPRRWGDRATPPVGTKRTCQPRWRTFTPEKKQPWNKQSWARRSPAFTNLVNTLKTKFSW